MGCVSGSQVGLVYLHVHSIYPFIAAFIVASIDHLLWARFVQHIGTTEITRTHPWHMRSSKSGVWRYRVSRTICLKSGKDRLRGG